MEKQYLKNWQLSADDLLDLIQAAFLEGQIDGKHMLLAYRLAKNSSALCKKSNRDLA